LMYRLINRLIDECINKHNQRLSHGGRGDGGEYGLSHKGKTREIIVLRRKCYNGQGEVSRQKKP
ncbi:hypothetical protein M1N42_04900, partial [Thermodesulfovibrionales bacterium]|nr:hypothetical protein [Thermodesulfovibrionales bacterium]MCL0086423.1 hypothetical protein [Thermodesulfovibrionales bacterium]